MAIENATDRVHWFNIVVYKKNQGSEVIFRKSFKNLQWQTRIKYDWFFKYYAALQQVKNPRSTVVTTWGNEPATGKTLEKIIEDKKRAKKGKITEIKNKLQKAVNNWDQIFPIEDDIYFKKANAKLKKIEDELKAL